MAAVNLALVELWLYLGISIVWVFTRVFVRWKAQSVHGLAIDDYLMVFVIILYSGETSIGQIVNDRWHGLGNSGMTDEERANLDPNSEEWDLRVKGSQTHLAGWLIYTAILWTIKICWLFFYKRLAGGVDVMTFWVKWGFVFCGLTFIATFLTTLCGCWPISRHWQINPDPGNACQLGVARVRAWVMLFTNLSTDVYIMVIPLPVIWNSTFSIKKKFGLAFLFCAGITTAIFGGIRCGIILRGWSKDVGMTCRWSHRETFLGILTANVPVVVPLLRRQLHRIIGWSASWRASGDTSEASDRQDGAKKFYKMKHGTAERKRFKHPLSLPGETFFEGCGSVEELVDMDTTTKQESQTNMLRSVDHHDSK
ncbi:hypothetical protein ACRE_040410 [Hapsidospora chrysogenum ATCC 11550]|uniref:Rhodopsin domain-containing protein n=1 Tax=Hapsidospora chrysogenum (strain ATCC 11550 / CBS 779.69 / DSM 880 / IAM 14645 / JCM 23072 / IMI 49137) TaxID=857340 RepID=A0A086T726_HAPC1|nr:hypothetical protein ACRE_040410 [Hapsidospora chrysogenum ATCC 11550]